MIDFWKNKRRRTWKTILKELAILALPLFLVFYGLKCVIALHGQMIAHIKTLGPFLIPVHGMASVMTGLSYIGFGLFIGLSFSNPPDERRSKLWRIVRGLLRWSGLVAWIWCALQARQLAGVDSSSPNFPIQDEIRPLLPFVFLFGFLAIIFWASTMAGRKSIKQDLYEKGLEPINIRARPLSYWGRGQGMTFRVIYLDKGGFTHRAYCSVSGRNVDRVNWFKDEIDVIDV